MTSPYSFIDEYLNEFNDTLYNDYIDLSNRNRELHEKFTKMKEEIRKTFGGQLFSELEEIEKEIRQFSKNNFYTEIKMPTPVSSPENIKRMEEVKRVKIEKEEDWETSIMGTDQYTEFLDCITDFGFKPLSGLENGKVKFSDTLFVPEEVVLRYNRDDLL